MIIRIKYFGDVSKVLQCSLGDWIDLRSRLDLKYKQGELVKVPLGVAMELPRGCEAHLAARSSTCKKFGLIPANGFGIIDNSYCGDDDEWSFLGYAIRDGEINTGDRVCQFRVVKSMKDVQFGEVSFLGNSNRGGFGSTGVK